jgi:hypothetical protein
MFLPVLAGAVLILTLFFAAAAGAQQETTASDTTTSTADVAQEVTAADDNRNADGVRGAESFRCEFFLRVVRDDRGALRDQYRDDEVVVQRFEQCLSEDVLADTIPNRNLPFTGGMPLLFLGAIGLAAIVAGVSVLRAALRHRR